MDTVASSSSLSSSCTAVAVTVCGTCQSAAANSSRSGDTVTAPGSSEASATVAVAPGGVDRRTAKVASRPSSILSAFGSASTRGTSRMATAAAVADSASRKPVVVTRGLKTTVSPSSPTSSSLASSVAVHVSGVASQASKRCAAPGGTSA